MATRVDVINFVRAESDVQMERYAAVSGGTGILKHNRNPAPISNQITIRMNRDTLYSFAVLDLAEGGPAELTLPTPTELITSDGKKTGRTRYLSLQVVSQDHFSSVYHGPNIVRISAESLGTRYAFIIIRTFADTFSKQDMQAAHETQNQVKLHQAQRGSTDGLGKWDRKSLSQVRRKINDLASTANLFGKPNLFGTKDLVDPIPHLLGTAFGWGGLQTSEVIYTSGFSVQNDGVTPHTLVMPADVPVDAFWSVSVYNKDGFFTENELGLYTHNSATSIANTDGSVSIHFGGDNKRNNYLPLPGPGWNIILRFYQPHKSLSNGNWRAPRLVADVPTTKSNL